ncbi:RabGAP/TBC [Dendrothele bispora CBS 962.96]|uniref:RabGAP/TBC n=1 Tax=Dendrothele bispora (strain CBS 962.96) TaxID=1314807 RepID=A0A4V4HF06_DENBC|nr:RabGAP/TBC [Dendrothele bispora CBS 962.96]
MDFELIRPTLGFAQPSARSSEDSGLNIPRGPDGRPDPSLFLRADSPAGSVSSGMSGNSRGDLGPRPKPMTRSSDNEASNESHRQREQKWMILIATVPPAQARKSKKVRKLIGDGVPSSVRYLVWSHLTDCKAKNVPGVYTNFVKRAKVPSFQDINRDVKQCFGEHPHLQSTEGPLLSLLQAYLTMVPDVRYSTGLTLIAGQLLLLAPEEDAFWIFVTMMDSVLRPYYSPSSTQLEVDAALFSRALEANDAQVSKKILVDMSMNPAHVCSPWYVPLFVGIIPGDYVNRLWDLFLYEGSSKQINGRTDSPLGVPFLIRAGLAIIYCCRRAILEATSENAVLQYLKRPPPTWLPPSPEAFVTLSLSFKVKDDDVRKQRVKMEAQVKRQAQAPPRSTGGAISLPRS